MNKYYNRLYLCETNNEKIECTMFNNVKEIKKYKTKNVLNFGVNYAYPVYGLSDIVIPICKYTPSFMDLFILRYKLHKINKVEIIKKTNKKIE